VAIRRASADTIGDARTVIYVHGIGNKPIASILKCQWDTALFGFDVGERSRLAYWVNREFYPDPTAATCQTGDTIALEEQPTGRSLSLAAHLGSVSLEDEIQAITDDQRARRTLLQIARTMETEGAQPAAPMRARGVGAKVLPLPSVLRDWITRGLVRAFLRDVNDYFFVPERRRAMRESVLERLRAGGGPFIVVAHSQGSMIAYDVLQSLEADAADVALFVTIGSPLGLDEVQDQVKRLTGQSRLAVPTCVRRWLNVADPLDPVALDKTLGGDFEPGQFIEDDLEWNPDSPRHPHSGTGYLSTKPVRTTVRDATDVGLFQQVADFVVARDLVRDIANHPDEQRHPVLIEMASDRSATDLEKTRQTVIAAIRRTVGVTDDELRLEPLRHFIAADLRRTEIETLSSLPTLRAVQIRRVWRNATKRALLDVSINTVQAPPAHGGYSARGRGIVWAVLDTGINPEHSHFRGVVGPQWDCTKRGAPSDARGTVTDENGHGTHVAGIIAGAQTFAKPDERPRVMSGIAPEATLHVYRVLDREGSGEDAWIIKALDHVFETNQRSGGLVIHGVNLSLGGPFDQSVFGCGHSPLCAELRRLWRQGVVVVLAAGNEGFAVLKTEEGDVEANMDLSIGDPANLEEAIAVGSIHKENPHTYGVSYFSSRGPTADGRQKPDLVAPGERISSCRHKYRANGQDVNDLYVEMSGTSMAAPHVSGVLAAFLSIRREFIGRPDDVKRILLANCTDLLRDRPQQGAGMPNLVRMLLNT
jgi:subtilisin family serine protease